jgi:hypothetical protein
VAAAASGLGWDRFRRSRMPLVVGRRSETTKPIWPPYVPALLAFSFLLVLTGVTGRAISEVSPTSTNPSPVKQPTPPEPSGRPFIDLSFGEILMGVIGLVIALVGLYVGIRAMYWGRVAALEQRRRDEEQRQQDEEQRLLDDPIYQARLWEGASEKFDQIERLLGALSLLIPRLRSLRSDAYILDYETFDLTIAKFGENESRFQAYQAEQAHFLGYFTQATSEIQTAAVIVSKLRDDRALYLAQTLVRIEGTLAPIARDPTIPFERVLALVAEAIDVVGRGESSGAFPPEL